MNLKKSQADILYKSIIKNPDKHKMIYDFFRNEAYAIIRIKTLINKCKDDMSYIYNLPLMKQQICLIRTNKLKLIENQFGIFDFNQKQYFKKLLDDLEIT